MPTPTPSASISLAPADPRCRYWAKILRAGSAESTLLPAPARVLRAADIPGAYAPRGEDELLPGDVAIEAEERHHRKARGWQYLVTVCAPDGTAHILMPTAAFKAQMKAAGMPAELLTGSGDLAACVRLVHGLRGGWLTIEEV